MESGVPLRSLATEALLLLVIGYRDYLTALAVTEPRLGREIVETCRDIERSAVPLLRTPATAPRRTAATCPPDDRRPSDALTKLTICPVLNPTSASGAPICTGHSQTCYNSTRKPVAMAEPRITARPPAALSPQGGGRAGGTTTTPNQTRNPKPNNQPMQT